MRETSPPPLPTLTSSPPLVTRSQAEEAATGARPGRGLEAAGTWGGVGILYSEEDRLFSFKKRFAKILQSTP